jgi:hypothetical protein
LFKLIDATWTDLLAGAFAVTPVLKDLDIADFYLFNVGIGKLKARILALFT